MAAFGSRSIPQPFHPRLQFGPFFVLRQRRCKTTHPPSSGDTIRKAHTTVYGKVCLIMLIALCVKAGSKTCRSDAFIAHENDQVALGGLQLISCHVSLRLTLQPFDWPLGFEQHHAL
mmetsp:Transcript_56551/g.93457  ORF Transcript_56551/g.93457 Transcript_56551/m.93457 type:complete len:117 (-) Transcript_56551:117-467(-)